MNLGLLFFSGFELNHHLHVFLIDELILILNILDDVLEVVFTDEDGRDKDLISKAIVEDLYFFGFLDVVIYYDGEGSIDVLSVFDLGNE